MNNELDTAARALGESLHQADVVRSYLEARVDCEADAALVAQEAHMQSVYEMLVARQQAGEQLSREEVERFYALRHRVQSAPVTQHWRMSNACSPTPQPRSTVSSG